MSDIAAVLRHYGAEHVPTGLGWRAVNCPFHADRHASAQVDHDQNRFRCFTCGIYDDACGLVMEREGMKFPDARGFVGGLAG